MNNDIIDRFHDALCASPPAAKDILVVFGAPDHESMAAIELCGFLGVTTATATVGGRPCHAGNALAVDGFVRDDAREDFSDDAFDVVLFECGLGAASTARVIAVCDHHNPGDYGFGRPPAEYWQASSVGQMYHMFQMRGLISLGPRGSHTGVPLDLLMVAAGDHCPADAYAGRCPDIDLVEFGAFRRRQIASVDGIPLTEVDAAISSAIAALLAAPSSADIPGCAVRDLRGLGEIAQLPEAALATGQAYVCEIPERGRDRSPTGNRKIVLGGHTTPEQVGAFRAWADALPGSIGGSYGDPVRGFAGIVLSAGVRS